MDDHKVFVYGTLRRGGGNDHLLRRAEFLGEAVATGKMYMGPGFPYGMFAAWSDSGPHVIGEIYRVDHTTLVRLDHLEGYNESTDSGMYRRIKTMVKCADGTMLDVWAYHINHGRGISEQSFIKSGDFIKDRPTWRW